MLDKTKIPTGPYCYRIKKIVPDPVYGVRILTKNCPYSRIKEIDGVEVAWCDYLEKGGLLNETTDINKLIEHYGSEDAMFEALSLTLLFDSVKECGIKTGDD
jgi:hypothetical protein